MTKKKETKKVKTDRLSLSEESMIDAIEKVEQLNQIIDCGMSKAAKEDEPKPMTRKDSIQ